jgi:hypothetical protein
MTEHIEDLAPDTHPDRDHATKRGKTAANRDALDRARIRGVKRSQGGRRKAPSITLPAISIQKRGE